MLPGEPNLVEEAQQLSSLESTRYLRERLQPGPGDLCYLSLKDLLKSLKAINLQHFRQVLDYGCGGSPYRSLFAANADYLRADLDGTGSGSHDVSFTADGRLPLESARFDCVLSTQVLEHVFDSNAYLKEALRLLKPGGSLILTTHGTFPDHACPGDYRRWTADGLANDLVGAGFIDVQMTKMTLGMRALAQLLVTAPPFTHRRYRPRWIFGPMLTLALRLLRSPFHRTVDWLTFDQAAGQPTQPGSETYIGLLAVARK